MPADDPTPPTEAEEAFARFLLSRSHGSVRSIDDLVKANPELADELERLHELWSKTELGDSQQSLRKRLRAKRGSDLDPGIELEHEPQGHPGDEDSRRASDSGRALDRIRGDRPDSQRYTMHGEIARGGMGAIYKVWDEDLRRSLAMKVVLGKSDEDDSVDDVKLARFLEEAQITGQLDHPGVVPVHEIGINSDGRVFFTMQLVKGRDLKEIFGLVRAETEGWSRTRALNVIQRVCEAMAFAHEKQVIHRDIKPANVMVGRFGETYVMDWGLAKVLGREDSHDVRIRPADQVSLTIVKTDRGDSSCSQDSPLQTMDGDVVGTPCYMAPEQARGILEDIGPETDIYAVGALLYELLTGFAPYLTSGERASPVAVLGMVIQGPPTAIAALDRSVPSELIAICEKAMARAPEDRYASMMAMAEDLRAFLENRVVRAYETGALAEFKKWVGRNRGMAAAMAAAGLAALLGLGGVAAVQAQANEELKLTNDQLSTTRDQLAASNTEIATANEGLLAATDMAQEKEREARAFAYSANLAAAAASLASGAVKETKRRLELCPEELRGWEWYRLDLETDSSAWSRELGPESKPLTPFSAAAIDPLGRRAAFATGWNTVLVIDPRSGETLVEFAHPRTASSLAFTPDGEHLVTGAHDRLIHVFRADTGEEVRSFGARRSIKGIDISSDGARIVSVGTDKAARVWDFESGSVLFEVPLEASGLCARWSPDGTRFATGAQDRTVRVHDGASGEILWALEGHDMPISDLAFDPTGRFVASGELRFRIDNSGRAAPQESNVRVWDIESGREVGVLRGHTGGITSVNFLHGQEVVTTSMDGSVRRFDLNTGRSRASYGHSKPPVRAVVTPDGATLVTAGADFTLRGWTLGCATGIDLAAHPRAFVGLESTPDGRIAALSRDGILRIQDPATGEVLSDFRQHPGVGFALACATDTDLLATVGGSFDAIGTRALTKLSLWDLATDTLVLERDFEQTANDLDITPDGRLLVAGTIAGEVLVVDLEKRDLRATLDHGGSVDDVSLSPDGRTVVASGSRGASTLVWDLETGSSRVLQEAASRGLRFVAGGELIALCTASRASLWRADDLTRMAVFRGHADQVESVDLSPDGTRLATASNDGTVRIWNAATGDQLLSLTDLPGRPIRIRYLPDGERLAVGFEDGNLHVLAAKRSDAAERAYREGRRVLGVAHRVLAPLFDELVDPEEVARRIQANEALDRTVLQAALNLTRRIESTSQQLEEESLPIVVSRFSVESELEEVVWKARHACARHPEDEMAQRLLGAAYFRLGQYELALLALERSDASRTGSMRRARPDVAAFLAMTNHRLERPDESARHLERLRGLMSIGALQSNRDSVALMSETEELLERRVRSQDN